MRSTEDGGELGHEVEAVGLVDAEVVLGVVEGQKRLQGIGGSGERVMHGAEHRLKSGHINRSGSLIRWVRESSWRREWGESYARDGAQTEVCATLIDRSRQGRDGDAWSRRQID